MDVGSMLYNSLKDVTWSSTTLPLDRLVSAYRLPQVVKLDGGKVELRRLPLLLHTQLNTLGPILVCENVFLV